MTASGLERLVPRGWSLRARLQLVLLPIVAGLLLLMGVGHYSRARALLVEQARRETAAALRAAADRLERILDRPVSDLRTLARHETIESHHFALRFGTGSDESEGALSRSLQEFLVANPHYGIAAYVDEEGATVIASGTGLVSPGTRDELRSWIAASADTLRAAPVLPRAGPEGESPSLRYATRIVEAHGQIRPPWGALDPTGSSPAAGVPVGTLVLELDEGGLRSELSDLALELRGAIRVLGPSGVTVHEAGREPDGGSVLDDFLAAAGPGPSGTIVQPATGVALGYWVPTGESAALRALGWRLGIALPNDILRRDLPALLRDTLILTLASIGIVSYIGVVFVRRLTRPLTDLSSAIRRAGEGDLTVRVGAGGGPEIEIVAASFNRMVEDLDEHRTLLRERIDEADRLRVHLENVIESAPDPLVVVNREGRVTYWNGAAEVATGCTRSSVLDQVLFELPGYGGYREAFERVRDSGRPEVLRREAFPRLEGPEGIRDVTLYPLGRDDPEAVVVTTVDRTEVERLEQMMIHGEKMASLGGLAAGMAHELNNPLAGILSSIQTLERRLDLDRERTRTHLAEAGIEAELVPRLRDFFQRQALGSYVELVRECGENAARIVGNLLSFSRREQRRITREPVQPLVEDTLVLLRAEYDLDPARPLGRLSIQLDVPSGTPPLDCDRGEIQQVLLNLIKNAAQSLIGEIDRDPGFEPRLMIRGGHDAERVWIRIEDNGPGIDPAVRAHVFDPFYTTKDVGQGTGLGLSVSYFIVTEGHGGTLRVEETTGGGATFVLSLPRMTATEPAKETT